MDVCQGEGRNQKDDMAVVESVVCSDADRLDCKQNHRRHQDTSHESVCEVEHVQQLIVGVRPAILVARRKATCDAVEQDLNESHASDRSVKHDKAVERYVEQVDERILMICGNNNRDEVGYGDCSTAMCDRYQECIGVKGVGEIPESQKDVGADYQK